MVIFWKFLLELLSSVTVELVRGFNFKTNILNPSYLSIKPFLLDFLFPRVAYASINGWIRISLANEVLRNLFLCVLLRM